MTPSRQRKVLILAGGAGTRLWPLSTDDDPKQFLELFGGRSLIRMTFDRFRHLVPAESIFVATTSKYQTRVAEQLPMLPPGNILIETERRNTGPAIAVCCFEIEKRAGDCTIGIFASDHAIEPEERFLASVDAAFDAAERDDILMTIGITPTDPNTGYGYLELGDRLDGETFDVRRFVEKPDLAQAKKFLEAGNFLWNGSMFLWRVSVFRTELALAAPELLSLAERTAAATDEGEKRRLYASMPSISIDYALMEKARRVGTVIGTFQWSDVGSWKAVAALNRSVANPNVIASPGGEIFVHAGQKRPVVVLGLDNLIVIDAPEGLLIMNSDHADQLSAIVKTIDAKRVSRA